MTDVEGDIEITGTVPAKRAGTSESSKKSIKERGERRQYDPLGSHRCTERNRMDFWAPLNVKELSTIGRGNIQPEKSSKSN